MDFDLMAESFALRGLKTSFGIPGSGATLQLIDAMEKRGIIFHLTRFEGSGVLMAGTIGRLTGRAGLSLSIKGPGLANAVPGLAATWFEAFPVVHLAEAAPRNAPASQAHKRLDHAAVVNGVTKGLFTLSEIDAGMNTPFTRAESEEPGPIVLELVDYADMPTTLPESIAMKGKAESMLKLIERSERPVVIAGALAVRKGWGIDLARLGIPVFSTAAAKGVVDETLPHSAGVYTGAGARLTPEFQLLPRADLVVAIGLTAREVLVAKPFHCSAIAIGAVETVGHEGFSFIESAGIEVAGPVMHALARKAWGIDELTGIKRKLFSYMTEDFLPGQVFELIYKHFAGRARAVLDTGYFCTIGEHAWPAQKAEWCLLSGQGRYMGTGLPMALGASLHDPLVPTIVFLGDGGIGMYPTEVALAVRNRLPLLIVLMSDNAFGSLRTRAIRDSLTQTPLMMDGRSWTGFFNAFGIPGTRAENIEAVSEAITDWNPDSGPAFLEIVFDPDKYESMVKGIR
jgi:acetolactate synthase-1/2/3 large subunit